MINFTSPVTGLAITGLTSPTYTLSADSAPPVGVSKSWYVSNLGGTQTGVDVHTIASPFTTSWKNPKVLLAPGVVDATGVYRAASKRNVYEHITRKGAVPLAGQQPRLCMIKTIIEVEAGAETADKVELLAMLSLHYGAGTSNINGIVDTICTGVA